PEPKVEEVRHVRAEHDELAVRDVHDFGDAPDEVQAVRDDREDAAEQQAEGEVRHEQRDVGHAAPRASGLCTRVRILARSIRDVARQEDLLHPRLTLDEDNRVGDLKASRVHLAQYETDHNVYTPSRYT